MRTLLTHNCVNIVKMNISTKISNRQLNLLKDKFGKHQLNNPNSYVVFFARILDATITVFKNNKNSKLSLTITEKEEGTTKKIVKLLGIKNVTENSSNKEKKINGFQFNDDQIGSDEVGTGDFFGPITVVAALVRKEDITRLKKLGVTDSKKISDKKILELGKIVIKEFPYSSLCVDNTKYNEIFSKEFNMNAIKAYLHNRALSNLKKKYPSIENIYVDQFVDEEYYYKYLKNEKDVLKGIYFHTKGETYFPSVALASVIARYSFLLKMEELGKKYNLTLPFGANDVVVRFAIKFAKKYGIKELDKIVKKNFKTYNTVLESLK